MLRLTFDPFLVHPHPRVFRYTPEEGCLQTKCSGQDGVYLLLAIASKFGFPNLCLIKCMITSDFSPFGRDDQIVYGYNKKLDAFRGGKWIATLFGHKLILFQGVQNDCYNQKTV